jgi:hypothetical protein
MTGIILSREEISARAGEGEMDLQQPATCDEAVRTRELQAGRGNR